MQRNRLFILFFAVVLFSAAANVDAEGNCPPGFYPIGGQGVQGCAPIPGASNGGAGTQTPAPRVPTGEWIKTWGAIAVSPSTSDAGVSTAKLSRQDAESEAVRKCASSGAKDCVVDFAYRNQCASWVIPSGRSGKGKSGLGAGPTPETARASALRSCKNDQAGSCVEFYADCTEPYFKKY